ncbi:MAG: hypothetical protein U5Q16_10580 [Gammaproteobacteria bacterium]|nr:hypothetical protein [Gammaproteobacteria bacterium]
MLMHWLTNFPYPWEGQADLSAAPGAVLPLAALVIGAAFGKRYLGTSNQVRSHARS